jgi:hypothetical protein
MQTNTAVQAWLSRLPVPPASLAAGVNLQQLRQPVFRDPNVDVLLLASIFVGGKVCEIGSKATMSLSDAQALQKSTPPTVKII